MSDAWQQLANYLPTGTFLAYETIISIIVSADGRCSDAQKIIVAVFIGLLGLACFFSSFTDSVRDRKSKSTHYGIACCLGLWCPAMPKDVKARHRGAAADAAGERRLGDSRYRLDLQDLICAALSTAVFATLVLLTAPTTTCFYPPAGTCRTTATPVAGSNGTLLQVGTDCVPDGQGVPSTVVRAVPVIVVVASSLFFMFMRSPRQGLGFAEREHPLENGEPAPLSAVVEEGAAEESRPLNPAAEEGPLGSPGKEYRAPDVSTFEASPAGAAHDVSTLEASSAGAAHV